MNLDPNLLLESSKKKKDGIVITKSGRKKRAREPCIGIFCPYGRLTKAAWRRGDRVAQRKKGKERAHKLEGMRGTTASSSAGGRSNPLSQTQRLVAGLQNANIDLRSLGPARFETFVLYMAGSFFFRI